MRSCLRGPVIAALRAMRHVDWVETGTGNIQRVIIRLIMIVQLQCGRLSKWRSLIYIIVHHHSIFEVIMAAHGSRIRVVLVAQSLLTQAVEISVMVACCTSHHPSYNEVNTDASILPRSSFLRPIL